MAVVDARTASFSCRAFTDNLEPAVGRDLARSVERWDEHLDDTLIFRGADLVARALEEEKGDRDGEADQHADRVGVVPPAVEREGGLVGWTLVWSPRLPVYSSVPDAIIPSSDTSMVIDRQTAVAWSQRPQQQERRA